MSCNAPGLGQLIAAEQPRVGCRAGIGLYAPHGHCPANFPPKPPQFGLQGIELDARNADHLRRFDTHGKLPPSGKTAP